MPKTHAMNHASSTSGKGYPSKRPVFADFQPHMLYVYTYIFAQRTYIPYVPLYTHVLAETAFKMPVLNHLTLKSEPPVKRELLDLCRSIGTWRYMGTGLLLDYAVVLL